MKLLISFFALAIGIIFNADIAKAQMFWNQAAYFSGVNNSYMRVANSSELNITGSFTLEAWIKPESMPFARGIFGKGGTLGTAMEYGMRLSTTGRISLMTNGTQRLITRTITNVQDGRWTHVCGTYNSSTGLFSIYINGTLDTSAAILFASPPANTDSLFIGITGSTTPFKGLIDEVRIWNRSVADYEVEDNFRTTLGASSGKYSGLVCSITFQQNEALGEVFTTVDWSDNGNPGFLRNVIDSSFTGVPSETIAINDNLELDGNGEYVAAPDNISLSPTQQLTMSCWVYPRSASNSVIIHKGSPGGGAGTNYRLGIASRRFYAAINGNFSYVSNDSVPLERWTHITFAYQGSTGAYYFYTNGKLTTLGSINMGNIADGTDSFYVGGTPALLGFDGYIDEVKIIKDVKFEETIAQTMFRASEQSLADASATYSFDGYSYSTFDGVPQIYFRNNAGFGHAAFGRKPLSPMNRSDVSEFEGGFHIKTSSRRIPETGNIGAMIDDTLQILMSEAITDVDVFLAINHRFENDLEVTLIAPNGSQVELCRNNNQVSNANNFVTIFDDQAPTQLQNGRFAQFAPRINARNPINPVFSGLNTAGNWRLKINDIFNITGDDSGRLYAWGLRFNNRTSKPYIVGVSQFIQGFYRPATNLTLRDTLRYYFRNTASPYAIVDSAKSYITFNGEAYLNPTLISSGAFYFLHVRHRNSIETWSNVIKLDPLTYQLNYSFSASASQAYGSNQIQVDGLPVRYGIYGGDVDQGGEVDATDLSLIDNDAFNFSSGYIQTDITGDGFTDATDYSIADNNALNFVSAVLPGPEPLLPSEYLPGNRTMIYADVDPAMK